MHTTSTNPSILSDPRTTPSKHRFPYISRAGKARTAILLWLLGIPIPVIILIFLIKGCMT